ncbi:hypothetical protein BKA59DRAFT_461789 [Fusarium tricinctum]|uniref:Uncharacterized protein n=1 Tax=Fusarium tricinctum TaxID=61284 RepID=A0A8K0S8I8_9HYPO|nr:hypothetical protein BKA59DRAFT_461789 [Fusarium tricinctum]
MPCAWVVIVIMALLGLLFFKTSSINGCLLQMSLFTLSAILHRTSTSVELFTVNLDRHLLSQEPITGDTDQ